MVFVCQDCHYEFERIVKLAQCPDCGKTGHIRLATAEEGKAFQERKKEDVWAEPLPARVG